MHTDPPSHPPSDPPSDLLATASQRCTQILLASRSSSTGAPRWWEQLPRACLVGGGNCRGPASLARAAARTPLVGRSGCRGPALFRRRDRRHDDHGLEFGRSATLQQQARAPLVAGRRGRGPGVQRFMPPMACSALRRRWRDRRRDDHGLVGRGPGAAVGRRHVLHEADEQQRQRRPAGRRRQAAVRHEAALLASTLSRCRAAAALRQQHLRRLVRHVRRRAPARLARRRRRVGQLANVQADRRRGGPHGAVYLHTHTHAHAWKAGSI
eukprot:366437-Chlamydomonas_euryale.AAC.2